MKQLALYALLLAVLPAVSALVPLAHNETYVFNYNDSSNASLNETFYCAAENSTPVCSAVNLLLSLSPGQTVNTANGSCSAQATCSGTATVTLSNTTCIVHKTFQAGEKYTNKDTGCDIELEIEKAKTTTTQNTTVKQTQDTKVVKSGSQITVSSGNESINIPTNAESFSYTFQSTYYCPAEIKFDTQAETDDLLDICRKFVPFLVDQYIAPTLDYCRESAKTQVDDAKACGDQRQALQAEISQLNSDKAELQTRFDTCTQEKDVLAGERDSAQNSNDTKDVVIFVFVAFTIIFGALASFLAYRMSKGSTQ